MALYFTPPTWTRRVSMPGTDGDQLFSRMKYLQVGYGVIRDADGGYRQVNEMDDDEAAIAREVYLGGRSYPVSTQVAADLTAAGYGAYISEVV